MEKKLGRPITRGELIQVSFRFTPETMDIINEYRKATGAETRTEAVEDLIKLMQYYTTKV